MTLLRIERNKEVKRISLTPIERIQSKLETALLYRDSSKDRSFHKTLNEARAVAKTLNEYQMPYYISMLLNVAAQCSDMYMWAKENPDEAKKEETVYKVLKRLIK